MIAASFQSVQAAPSAVTTTSAAPEPLRRFAAQAIDQLAKTEPFAAWRHADSIIEPLGPGTHSWHVTVQSDKSSNNPILGYLIISITPEGEYKLVEYGLGPNSVFADPVLKSGLADLGLSLSNRSRPIVTPVYGGPLLAEWMIHTAADQSNTVQFLDAVTGELLPENQASFSKQEADYTPPLMAAGSGQHHLSAESSITLAEPFDPYDNLLWMTGGALRVSQSTFEHVLQANKRLVFVTTDPDRTYSFPLSVYGYQKWSLDSNSPADSAIYVLSGSDSTPRWIALDALLPGGKFVAYTDTGK